MVPAEVAAAQRVLAEKPRFGDKNQIEAMKIMSRWHEVACAYCTEGWHVTASHERYICNVCRGVGKVWTRR